MLQEEPTILHVSGQRPGQTGSGVFLRELIRQGKRANVRQAVVFGTTPDACQEDIAALDCPAYPVVFGTDELPIVIRGMSDVMPYSSATFSSLDGDELEQYLNAFRRALVQAAEYHDIDLIWSHHIWLASCLCKPVLGNTPQVVFSHGTELVQLERAPHLADYVLQHSGGIDHVCALSKPQKTDIQAAFGFSDSQVIITGGGIRDDIFFPPPSKPSPEQIEIVYVGKLSKVKGVPYLIDAFHQLSQASDLKLRLHIVGGGSGPEADQIRQELAAHESEGHIVAHGILQPPALADLMRSAHLFVLPSFYEGLGLVVLEALACGCRVVVTALDSIISALPQEAFASGVVKTVPAPTEISERSSDHGTPSEKEFIESLMQAIAGQAVAIPQDDESVSARCASFVSENTWTRLFDKAFALTRATKS